MKKSILIGVGVLIVVIIGIVYFYQALNSGTRPLSIPCYHLPEFVNEFENYYDNVEINQDACYPSFSFETPISYSNFGVQYTVKTKDIIDVQTIGEYDTKIKERIIKIEDCPDFERYVELSGQSTIPINYLLADYPRFESCKNMTGILEIMENHKIIRDFLSSREKFGDYDSCQWQETGSGSQALSYSYGKKYGKLVFYVFCDGVKEQILLVLDETGNVEEAYFQNSVSESYRKIYPEDVVLRERKPKWE